MKYVCRGCGQAIDSEDSGQRIQPTDSDELEHCHDLRGPFGGIMTVGCGPLVKQADEVSA